VVVQFGECIDPQLNARVRALAAYLQAHPFEGLVEYVPAYTSLTVYYDPWILSGGGKEKAYEKVTTLLCAMLPGTEAYQSDLQAAVVEIPVCYGGAFGPDLAFVARHNQLTEAEVIALHAGGTYTVYMLGFAPGFPYLGGMDERIAAPRRETPRACIPAGSVGIAGRQTGIYSLPTPGGWQLIGRTPSSLFDPQRKPPSLLQAGDQVRFVPISPEAYQAGKEQHDGA